MIERYVWYDITEWQPLINFNKVVLELNSYPYIIAGIYVDGIIDYVDGVIFTPETEDLDAMGSAFNVYTDNSEMFKCVKFMIMEEVK